MEFTVRAVPKRRSALSYPREFPDRRGEVFVRTFPAYGIQIQARPEAAVVDRSPAAFDAPLASVVHGRNSRHREQQAVQRIEMRLIRKPACRTVHVVIVHKAVR